MYLGLSILDICANEVLLGQNKKVLALTYFVYLNILAVHLNVYITNLCRNFYGVWKLRLLVWEYNTLYSQKFFKNRIFTYLLKKEIILVLLVSRWGMWDKFFSSKFYDICVVMSSIVYMYYVVFCSNDYTKFIESLFFILMMLWELWIGDRKEADRVMEIVNSTFRRHAGARKSKGVFR